MDLGLFVELKVHRHRKSPFISTENIQESVLRRNPNKLNIKLLLQTLIYQMITFNAVILAVHNERSRQLCTIRRKLNIFRKPNIVLI